MATYSEIASWIREHHDWTAKTCWIAHCKELNGLPVRSAANRLGIERMVPCAPSKRSAIEAAFRHFGMLNN